MAGFCEMALGLQAPDFYPIRAKTPKVSGRTPEYSHFRETGTGDWVSIGTTWPARQSYSRISLLIVAENRESSSATSSASL
jgi:hypothetical protein